MADEEDSGAPVAELLDEVEQLVGLLDAQGGGGFVEEQQPGRAEERPGDRDHLPLAAGEGGERRPHVGDVDGQGPQQLTGAALHLDLVEEAVPVDLPAEEEVADDVEVPAHREVLVDGGDAEGPGVVGASDLHGAALPDDLAPVRGTGPGDHLDQRGLAGRVAADQGDHLTGPDLQVDVHQRLDGGEALGDTVQREQGLDHGATASAHEVSPALAQADRSPGVQIWSTV